MKTPASLLERLRQPDQEKAWERFVQIYTPLLYHWARRNGCKPTESEDLVQEVLTLLVRKLPEFQYDSNKSFRSWLRTVATNCWRNQYRRVSLSFTANSDMATIESPVSDEPFWEEEYRRHLVARVLSLIQTDFQPATWQAFWQSVMEGKPAAGVAQGLGLSTGAVYMAKARVLSRLRQELDGMLD